MTSIEKIERLLTDIKPFTKRRKWVKGYIPDHYKRLNISKEKAEEFAVLGASFGLTYFKNKYFFTQALIMGAIMDQTYDTFVIVTPSQYGKSWLMAQVALALAFKERQVRVAAGEKSTTNIIMGHVIKQLKTSDDDIKKKVLDYKDKFEKLNSSLSKDRVTFKRGGLVEGITLGMSSNDPRRSNNAIGRGGVYIIDECALISDDVFAEVGRRDFSNIQGIREPLILISNPHKKGRFYDMLTDPYPRDRTLIVWMDIRTSVEEGRVRYPEQVFESEFFKNESTRVRYLLCDLEDYSESSMFSEIQVKEPPNEVQYFLGIDSAYKGKDDITICLSAQDKHGHIYLIDISKVDKCNWIDGQTSHRILTKLIEIIDRFKVKYVCVDIGQGIYITEGLAQEAYRFGYGIEGVNFGSGPTKERVKAKHYSAKYAYNKRAELHMDFKDLIEKERLYATEEVKEKLKDQMNATHMFIKSKDKYMVIEKEKIKKELKKSPDELDSAILSVHACIKYAIGGNEW